MQGLKLESSCKEESLDSRQLTKDKDKLTRSTNVLYVLPKFVVEVLQYILILCNCERKNIMWTKNVTS